MGARFPSFKPVLAALLLGLTPVGHVAAQDTARIDRLFADLAEAGPVETGEIEAEIRDAWSKSGSAAIDLLLRRGREALEAGDQRAAIEHLTAAIDHAPDFVEAYEARANAYYLAGLTGPAIEDLRLALLLEPRHFGALRGFAILLEEMGRPEDALETWGRVRDISPGDDTARAAQERLDIQLGGRTL
ncbi:tetratricopeptide repeat protein [Limimaricola pyoseonensis]|uniref:TPR repeat-containing protein n=1 Tax=Limimaricola pyoseonensis TaxID=521013 RepID=A0A1G7D2V5_9RHOB|nr:tetratricopeptide repeat protein [Limimaricola pyoseonensis]SDE45837.1 TPR repeat-containing protein [Limimaricola pyoseonensis]